MHQQQLLLPCLAFIGFVSIFSGLLADEPNDPTKTAPESAKPKLVVGTKEVAPFAFRNADGKWTGISIETWRHVANDLHVDYEFREMTLDEMLGALERKEIDAGVAAISVTAERSERIDFAHPHFTTGLGIAVSVDKNSSRWGGFFRRVFTRQVMVGAGIAISVILTLGLVFWLTESRAGDQAFGADRKQGLGLGIWWTVILLLGHKGVIPKTKLGRVLAASVMVTSILTFSIMTGVIASAMTVESLETPIQHPQDLRRVATGALKGSTSSEYLTARRITHRTFSTLDQALQAIEDGDIEAVVYDHSILKYTVSKKFADVIDVLPVKFNTQEYAIALVRDSQWRKPINQSLLSYRASDEWDDLTFRYLGE